MLESQCEMNANALNDVICVFVCIKRSPVFNLYNLSHYRIYVKFYLVSKRAHIPSASFTRTPFAPVCSVGVSLSDVLYCIKYFRIRIAIAANTEMPGFSWLSNTKFMNKIRVKRGQV